MLTGISYTTFLISAVVNQLRRKSPNSLEPI